MYDVSDYPQNTSSQPASHTCACIIMFDASRRMLTMKTKAMLALVVLGMFACLANASQPPSQCGHGACWRPPAAVLSESEGTSEREALVALFCSLDCVDSSAEV